MLMEADEHCLWKTEVIWGTEDVDVDLADIPGRVQDEMGLAGLIEGGTLQAVVMMVREIEECEIGAVEEEWVVVQSKDVCKKAILVR
jgi:hypothetical protein